MSWYLVKMTPVEPYSFGTDQNFSYENGEAKTGKETYFVNSNQIPEQTTVYGLIRYLILKDRGLLHPDFKYTQQERRQMQACIGDSFSFEKKGWNSGEINEMSPVFLISNEGHYLIKNPFCNTAEDSFSPMKMKGKTVSTSEGDIHLPDAYNSKEGYKRGWFDIDAGKPVIETPNNEIFTAYMQTGNKKNGTNPDREDSFFKREVIYLKDKYSFAVFVNTTSLPSKAIGYMGKKKSAFHITSCEAENDLEQKAKNALQSKGAGRWFYALSDIYTDTRRYKDFCIVEEKSIRTLTTKYDERTGRGRLAKSPLQTHMIASGSVFYGDSRPDVVSTNASRIGYNRIIEIGGE